MKFGNFKLFFVFLISLFSFRPLIMGEECSGQKLEVLRAHANYAEIKYAFLKESDNKFSVTINNLFSNYIVLVKDNSILFKYDSKREIPSTMTIDRFVGGREYIFEFYANTNDECNFELISSKRVRLPKFNLYSRDELCIGVEEYKLCDMWYSGPSISHKEFVKKVSEYRREKEERERKTDLSARNTWDIVFDYVVENYVVLSGGTAFSVIFIYLIFNIIKKKRDIL